MASLMRFILPVKGECRKAALCVGLIVLLPCPLTGQTQTKAPEFVAASLRQGDPDTRKGHLDISPGRLTAVNLSLRALIINAFDLRSFQLEGDPPWIESDRFSIIATADHVDGKGETKDDQRAQLMLRLQSLLEQRFDLQWHRTAKLLPGYNLVAAKSGFKLKPMGRSGNSGGHLSMTSMRNGRLLFSFERSSISEIVDTLTKLLNRRVNDSTGIRGVFDFSFEWSPNVLVASPSENSPFPNVPDRSLSTTLKDVGLKLEASRVLTEVFVIDHIGKPSFN